MRTVLDTYRPSVRSHGQRREDAQSIHASTQLYHLAHGGRIEDAAPDVLAMASAAESGAWWTHWWGAYVALMSRTSTWVPEPDPWADDHECRWPGCLQCTDREMR